MNEKGGQLDEKWNFFQCKYALIDGSTAAMSSEVAEFFWV